MGHCENCGRKGELYYTQTDKRLCNSCYDAYLMGFNDYKEVYVVGPRIRRRKGVNPSQREEEPINP